MGWPVAAAPLKGWPSCPQVTPGVDVLAGRHRWETPPFPLRCGLGPGGIPRKRPAAKFRQKGHEEG
eukprot:14005889-Ditylum_brightwellii.AAC.1